MTFLAIIFFNTRYSNTLNRIVLYFMTPCSLTNGSEKYNASIFGDEQLQVVVLMCVGVVCNKPDPWDNCLLFPSASLPNPLPEHHDLSMSLPHW